MKHGLMRVVFDCNVYFQALINEKGPAGKCVSYAFDRRLTLFLSAYVLKEVRRTATDPILRAKFRHLTDERLDQLMANVEKVGHVVAHVPEQFVYARDPDDAHYVNLALATGSEYIISRDKDLLALMAPNTSDGRQFAQRFPQLQIMDPPRLLQVLREVHDRTRKSEQ
jgi:putative PIN family toxin of toxin-antitoxin system